MRNVRVWFTKLGQAKYISHLDINRCMDRAIRRAQLPLWFTEGYNPHPYMTFSAPLPLGVESMCESMDIRILPDAFTNEMVKESLRAVMPVGLQIVAVNDSEMQAKQIAFAQYEIMLTLQSDPLLAVEALTQAIKSGELLAEKKSKSGRKKIMKTINLCEFIYSSNLSVVQTGQVKLSMLLCSGIQKNVNPILMVATILAKAQLNVSHQSILRQCLFVENLEPFK